MGPVFVVYKTALVEENCRPQFIKGGVAYVTTEFLKTFAMTFLPPMDHTKFDLIGETMKTLICAADVVGCWYILRSVGARKKLSLAVGLGWATAYSILYNFIPILIGGKEPEFSWRFFQMSIDANIKLVYFLNFAIVVYAWDKRPWRRTAKKLLGFYDFAITVLMVCIVFVPMVQTYCQVELELSPWSEIITMMILTSGLSFPVILFWKYLL